MKHLIHSDDMDYSQFFSIHYYDEEGYVIHYHFDDEEEATISGEFLDNLLKAVNSKAEQIKSSDKKINK